VQPEGFPAGKTDYQQAIKQFKKIADQKSNEKADFEPVKLCDLVCSRKPQSKILIDTVRFPFAIVKGR
jgi:hypothetical protein